MRSFTTFAVFAGIASMLCLGTKSQAQVAEVTLWGTCYGDFHFHVDIEVTGAPLGIASYSIDLVGIEYADALRTVVLRDGQPWAGFTMGGEDLEGDGTLFAAQNGASEPGILYGLGSQQPLTVAVGDFQDPLTMIPGFGDMVRVDVFVARGETVPAEVRLSMPSIDCPEQRRIAATSEMGIRSARRYDRSTRIGQGA